MKNDRLIIYGKNAVAELLNSDRLHSVNALYVQKGAKHLGEYIALAKKAGITVKEVSAEKLDSLSDGNRNGGLATALSSVEYSSVEEILGASANPFILIADGIEDPHNLGALIRTAEAAGVNGVIIQKRRCVQITSAVYSASAGAAAHMKIARVNNLTETIKELKSNGVWIYGAEADGTAYTEVNISKKDGKVALVIGSEGRGLSRLVRENCDFVISIPMYGKINSLNASVSGAILMFYFAEKGGGRD
ncbi:MAG: 23S rRNA (guanosine(2251)-2'-O)-methyltransferase RlmB [Oscillospiraceae bacterium]|nr:23S rRNA (guanosine(2251)-2'-O)-methyltransferase RlmB [Oscillospiraceae bacterium]